MSVSFTVENNRLKPVGAQNEALNKGVAIKSNPSNIEKRLGRYVNINVLDSNKQNLSVFVNKSSLVKFLALAEGKILKLEDGILHLARIGSDSKKLSERLVEAVKSPAVKAEETQGDVDEKQFGTEIGENADDIADLGDLEDAEAASTKIKQEEIGSDHETVDASAQVTAASSEKKGPKVEKTKELSTKINTKEAPPQGFNYLRLAAVANVALSIILAGTLFYVSTSAGAGQECDCNVIQNTSPAEQIVNDVIGSIASAFGYEA